MYHPYYQFTNGDTPPPTPNTFPIGGAGHPASIYWGVRKHKRFTKNLDWLMDRVVSEYYAELTDEDVPKAIKTEAAKIVKPYANDKKAVPEKVNWAALQKDAETMIRLLELYQRERELEDDEERWMMLN